VPPSVKQLLYNVIPFLVLFLLFITMLLLRKGFAYDMVSKKVMLEPYKYFNNFIEMPVVALLFLLGVGLVLYGIIISLFKTSVKGIWPTGIGTILTVLALFLVAGLNNTAYYPSTYDLQSSLTIENSSSSHYTLTAMSYVSLFVPFVLAYIFYTWRLMNKKQISTEELNEDTHVY